MASQYQRVLSDLFISDADGTDVVGQALKGLLSALATNDTSSATSGITYAQDVLTKASKYLDGGPSAREILAPLQSLADRRAQGH
jgi:hypothetical protein